MRLFRKLARWLGSGDTPDPPARLIDIPVFRDTPLELLAQLRTQDDRAELLYVGHGRWWVGRVKPDSPRRRHGRQMVTRILEGDGFHPDDWDTWAELRQGLLMTQGFGLCFGMRIQGTPDGRLVRRFERWLYDERTATIREKTLEAAVDAMENNPIIEAARKESANRDRERGKWAHRRLVKRNPKPVTNVWDGKERT